MTSELALSGVYVPLITPFTKGDDVAYGELEKLAHEAIDAGAAGLVALGTTGEPATLEENEKDQVIRIIGGVCRERKAHFQVGAGTNSTKSSLAAITKAAAGGADSVLCVVPYYTRPSERALVEHFKTLAAAAEVPVVVYNVPYRTGRGLGGSSLLELSVTPNIAGLKQAVGVVDIDSEMLLAEGPDGFVVLCGDDSFLFPLLALGAAGAIAASANMCTDGFVALVDAVHKGEMAEGRRLHNILLPVTQVLFAEPSPGVIKAVMHAQGRISTPNLRRPMTEASEFITNSATKIVETAQAQLASR